MAAPTFHKMRLVAPATATSVTITTPEGASAGDTLYIGIKVEGSEVTITAPVGWTKIGQKRTTANSGWQAAIFELPNWNGSTTTYKIEWGGGSHGYNAIISAFTGTDTQTPRNITGSEGIKENASSNNIAVQGYTTTVKECLPVTWAWNSAGLVVAPAEGWTEDGDQTDGPETAHKTTALPIAETLATVTHKFSSGTNVSLTIGFALQPPQPTGQPNMMVI